MNFKTKENLKAAAILVCFGVLILYAGHYLIGSVAIVGSVLVAIAPVVVSEKFQEKFFRVSLNKRSDSLPWYVSPLPYMAIVGLGVIYYAYTT
jgi:hypothetical protein